MLPRSERAARLRDYFDLQLRFAARLAERTGVPLAATVTTHTNLHRRFGFGMIGRGAPVAGWREYLSGLESCPTEAARLNWTMNCFVPAPDEPQPPGQRRFGCFACDEPTSEGEVRIHFTNVDGDGRSPLHATKVQQRRAELAALFAWVRERFPAAASVRGTSWLYHLDAYRRLFPLEYVASRRPPDTPLSFHGSSSWGQFIDHRERVRGAARDAFLARLPELDPARPGEAFPLPALLVTASLDVFLRHYASQPP